jgi:hypothetical protein
VRTGPLVGAALGALGSVAIVILPGLGSQPFLPLNLALIYAFLPGGLFLMLLLGWIALRRSLGNSALDDGPFPDVSGEDIDQKVLSDSVAQLVLALLIWPLAASWLGAVTVIVMGVGMGVARLLFWSGAHFSLALRSFGWTLSFGPTAVAFLWTLWKLLG